MSTHTLALAFENIRYKTVINEHKQGKIDHAEYVRKIVKLNRHKDLPKTRRALLRALESDSD